MPIDGIILRNFQAHAERKITFSSGISSILGPTDTGKSSILRALRWVLLNDFPGDAFVRDGAKRAEVVIAVGEDRVTRTRGGKENTYQLNGKEFKSFVNGVPQDVADILNVEVLNFQGQHDSPFWFTETAGEVSRQLNSIIDLSVIDTTLASVAQQVRQAQEREAMTRERLETAENQVKKLLPQRHRMEDFKQLKELYDETETCTEDHRLLVELVEQTSDNQEQSRWLQEKSEDAGKVYSVAGDFRSAESECLALDDLIADIEDAREKAKAPASFDVIESLHAEFKKMDDEFCELTDFMDSLGDIQKEIEKTTSELATAEKQFHKETHGTDCPLCQRKL